MTSSRYLFLALALTAVLFQLTGEGGIHTLQYHREPLFEGEIWRLFTAHLIHTGWPHLGLNLLALAIIWQLFGRLAPPASWSLATLLTAATTTLALLLIHPEVVWYVGLSGLLHGLLVVGLYHLWRNGERRLAGLVLFLLLLKLLYEQFAGSGPTEELIGARVIVESHRYGALSGLLYALFDSMRAVIGRAPR